MHRFFEKLKPAFFKAWDKRLLLNRPALWATKFHYALVLGLMGIACSSLAVWLMPIDTSAVPNVWGYFLLAALPSAIGLGIWIWQVSLFKTEKAFGEASTQTVLRDQLIYVLILLMVFGIPSLYTFQVSQKIANSIDDTTLVADINHLNLFEGFTSNYKNWGDEPKSLSERFDGYSFGAFSIYNNENTEILGATDNYPRFIYLSKPANEAALKQGLEKYVNLIAKYSTSPFTVDADVIYQEFSLWRNGEKKNIQFQQLYQSAENEAALNLKRIQGAKKGIAHLLYDLPWQVVLIIFLWGLGLLLVALQSNGRSFLISATLGVTTLVGGVVLAESLHYIWGFISSQSWLFSLHLLVMLVLGLLILRRKTTPKAILWHQIVLTLFVVGLAFIPMSLWHIVDELTAQFGFMGINMPDFHRIDVFFSLLHGGALFTLLLWNLGLRQSFIRLHVHPKR